MKYRTIQRFLRTAAFICMAGLTLSGCQKAETAEQTESISETEAGSEVETETTEPETTEEETEPLEEGHSDSVTATVSYSTESGVYADEFELSLSTEGDGAIYYTTDGSDPATSDTRILYTEPIAIRDRSNDPNVVSAVEPQYISGNFNEWLNATKEFYCTMEAPADDAVDKCTTIRAAVADTSHDVLIFGATSGATYYIGSAEDHIQGLAESCEAAGTSLAVISISMDYDDLFDADRGIYVKGTQFEEAEAELSGWVDSDTARRIAANYNSRGREWERECHIDFFEFDTDSQDLVLTQNCGIRIQGNYSRSDWQKGFRLYAREDYGSKRFEYAVFGEDLTDVEGERIDSFKTLVLRAGGNCAFTSKFNDTYWQDASSDMDVATKASRPCVVYLNGEYWGLYVLEEDYSENYFEDHYGVDSDDVVIYKGDAETYESGYKLDEGDLPEGTTDESYYLNDLDEFFRTHDNLESEEDYEAFAELVDVESVKDYFLAEVWINNKWDWPGKNWSMWRTMTEEEQAALATEDSETEDAGNEDSDTDNVYNDHRWRLMFYDMEFGGVSGDSDAYTNTIKEDNYKTYGLLDMDTKNPAVLCFAYLMTNEGFREEYCSELLALSEGQYEKETLTELLDTYEAVYSPLYDQFFARYPESGTTENAINGGYASIKCIRDFIAKRGDHIQTMVDWVERTLGS